MHPHIPPCIVVMAFHLAFPLPFIFVVLSFVCVTWQRETATTRGTSTTSDRNVGRERNEPRGNSTMKAFRTHTHTQSNTHTAHSQRAQCVCTNKTCGNKFETDHINHIQVKLNTRAQLEETHTHTHPINTHTHTAKCVHTHIYYMYLCIFTCSIKKILTLL